MSWESWKKELQRINAQKWSIEPDGNWGVAWGLSGGVTRFKLTSAQESFKAYFTGIGAGLPLEIDTSEKVDPPDVTVLRVFCPLDIRGVRGLYTGGKTGMLIDLGAAKIPVVHFTSLTEPVSGTSLTLSELASWGITSLLDLEQSHKSTIIGAAAYIPTGEIKSAVKGQYGFWSVW